MKTKVIFRKRWSYLLKQNEIVAILPSKGSYAKMLYGGFQGKISVVDTEYIYYRDHTKPVLKEEYQVFLQKLIKEGYNFEIINEWVPEEKKKSIKGIEFG